jgi:hypothetical protein
MIRKDLVDIIYGEVFVKTESINGYLSKEYITNVINSYQTTTDSNNKIPDKTKVINLFVDNDYTIFNDKNANINGTYNLNSCMSILESAYEMDFIKNNDTVNDIINCFLWKMTSVDQRTVSLKNIKDALSNRKENYSYYGDKTYYKVLNNLEKALDTYMKNQNNANLQTHMASLRNIDQRMKDNANNIITMVFIFSYIFVVIILFIIYHIFYIMYEDEMQILLSASILLLIIAVTVYAWIIGNLK